MSQIPSYQIPDRYAPANPSPKIYTSTIEEINNTGTKQVFFKMFLINNRLSLPSGDNQVIWGATDPNVLDSDIDSFQGRVLTRPHKISGKHPDPKDAGIFEPNYPNKLDFVNDAINYYKDYGVAKIVDIYKPDPRLLTAAYQDPSIVINYEALGSTTDPEFINYLEEMKKQNKDIYVSPAVYALDSYKDAQGRIIVKRFVGLHSSIVDDPAHTKAIAFLKKETCNQDHKTCYYKLLTAAQVLNLNNNDPTNTNMAEQPNPSLSVTSPSITDDINKAGIVADQDLSNVNIKTDVIDSKGNLKETINTNTDPKPVNTEPEKPKEDTKKEIKKETKKETKEDHESLTASQLKEILGGFKQEIFTEMEAKQNQKQEATTKLHIVNTFIPPNVETNKPDYDFYNSLPVSSAQLKKIMEDSKFNKGKKVENTFVASTSENIAQSNYNDNSNNVTSHRPLHYLTTGEKIPKKYQ